MNKRTSTPGKPITPRMHGIIDYGLAAGNLVLPGLLKLRPSLIGVFAAFGVIQGALNSVTTQPLAVQKVVPFKVHGTIDKSSVPLYLLAPLAAGVVRDKRGRWYWLGLGAALITVYNLTDWNAKKTDR
ncbi:hypothetical protein ACPW96_09550 [Micromonospora sp. DT81.3]|uniref:hypothetical protein n=1 Tax=Actinomycetes TaxID=1760 RepID=UPI003CF21881